jgi:hypothetical protein
MTNINDFNGADETVNQPSYDFEGSSPSSPTIEIAGEIPISPAIFYGWTMSDRVRGITSRP